MVWYGSITSFLVLVSSTLLDVTFKKFYVVWLLCETTIKFVFSPEKSNLLSCIPLVNVYFFFYGIFVFSFSGYPSYMMETFRPIKFSYKFFLSVSFQLILKCVEPLAAESSKLLQAVCDSSFLIFANIVYTSASLLSPSQVEFNHL